LPAPAEPLATDTVIVQAAPANEPPGVALYARVSSPGQKADLDRQLARLAEFSAQHGFRVVEAVRYTGAGWNGRRKARLRIFRNPNIQVIVVERRDRLMRFGLEVCRGRSCGAGPPRGGGGRWRENRRYRA